MLKKTNTSFYRWHRYQKGFLIQHRTLESIFFLIYFVCNIIYLIYKQFYQQIIFLIKTLSIFKIYFCNFVKKKKLKHLSVDSFFLLKAWGTKLKRNSFCN